MDSNEIFVNIHWNLPVQNVHFIKRERQSFDILGRLKFYTKQYELLVNHQFNSQSFEIVNSAQLKYGNISIMSLNI
jgi:hypothetical protein